MPEMEMITPFKPAGTGSAVAQPTPEATKSTQSVETPAQPVAPAPAATGDAVGGHLTDLLTTPEAEAGAAAASVEADDDLELADEDDPLGLADEDEPVAEPVAASPQALRSERARRRILADKARKAEEEAAELRRQVEDLKTREIDEDSIRAYRKLQADKSAAEQEAQAFKLRAHYDASWRVAAQQARAKGEEEPEYAGDQWVAQQLQAMQPKLGPDDVRNIIRTELRGVMDESKAEMQTLAQKREEAAAEERFLKDLKAQVKADPIVRHYAKDIVDLWRARGRQGTAEQYVKRLTAPQRKVAALATSGRAEHARSAVPLRSGGGAPAPKGGNDILKRIEDERMEVGDLLAAVHSGRLDLNQR